MMPEFQVYVSAGTWPAELESTINVDLSSNIVGSNVNYVYRSSPTIIVNDVYPETRSLVFAPIPTSASPIPTTSASPCPSQMYSSSPSPSPCLSQMYSSSPCSGQMYSSSSSPSQINSQIQHSRKSSTGDPLENNEIPSRSPLEATEPHNYYVSTIQVSRARLQELEYIERNISTIVAEGLMEYIRNENLNLESLESSENDLVPKLSTP